MLKTLPAGSGQIGGSRYPSWSASVFEERATHPVVVGGPHPCVATYNPCGVIRWSDKGARHPDAVAGTRLVVPTHLGGLRVAKDGHAPSQIR